MRYVGVCIVGVLCWGLLAVGLAGCGNSQTEEPAVEVNWELQPEPARVGSTTVTITLSDSTGRPVSGADVSVEGNMAHAGMSPVFADVTERDSGRYVAPMEFTMAGDWFLLVDVALPDGSTIEETIDVPGVQPK